MSKLIYSDLGRESYESALAIQRRLLEEVKADENSPAYLLLLEHDPPVITLGRSAGSEHILASQEQLSREGIEVRESARGGDVTYHGPGQLVGYPIIRLTRSGRTVRGYVRSLEEVIIRLLGRFGLSARRREGLTGVWVGDEKIAAIGVAVSRWVAWHGFALNVSMDLSHFDFIVPCGIDGCKVTSMERLLASEVSIQEVKKQLVECMAEVFGFEPVGWAGGPPSLCQRTKVGLRPSLQNQGGPPAQPTVPSHRGRFPAWLRRRIPPAGRSGEVRRLLADLKLETVCSSANCPNMSECFGRGTATFMILGSTCTRSCRFCAVPTGKPTQPREDEPAAVAEASERLGLKHVVITSVTRDDLSDGGAGHFAKTIRAVQTRLPQTTIEVLTPDFGGDEAAIDTVLSAGPDVFNHNIETVPRLYSHVRPQARYKRSLQVLKYATCRLGRQAHLPYANEQRWASGPAYRLLTKSGLMVGLGETNDEIRDVMRDLREAGCDILTIGQYLAPSSEHVPIERFVEPSEFDALRTDALEMGFSAVAVGPFVRSSYRAEEVFKKQAVL